MTRHGTTGADLTAVTRSGVVAADHEPKFRSNRLLQDRGSGLCAFCGIWCALVEASLTLLLSDVAPHRVVLAHLGVLVLYDHAPEGHAP